LDSGMASQAFSKDREARSPQRSMLKTILMFFKGWLPQSGLLMWKKWYGVPQEEGVGRFSTTSFGSEPLGQIQIRTIPCPGAISVAQVPTPCSLALASLPSMSIANCGQPMFIPLPSS